MQRSKKDKQNEKERQKRRTKQIHSIHQSMLLEQKRQESMRKSREFVAVPLVRPWTQRA